MDGKTEDVKMKDSFSHQLSQWLTGNLKQYLPVLGPSLYFLLVKHLARLSIKFNLQFTSPINFFFLNKLNPSKNVHLQAILTIQSSCSKDDRVNHGKSRREKDSWF